MPGNKATNGGGIGCFSSDNNTCQIQISGTPVIKNNTLADGTTPCNIQPLSAGHLVLAAPLGDGAEVGVTYASGVEFAVIGKTELATAGSGAERIFYDGNPVDGKTRTGGIYEGSLVWVNEGEDPETIPIRATNDGGTTWALKRTFKAAIAHMTGSSTDKNIIELRKDLQVTDDDRGTHPSYPGSVGIGCSYTLRSMDVRRTLNWSQCSGGYFATGGTHCFSNIVITGMRTYMQTRLKVPFHFYDGVLFTNNTTSSLAPIYGDSSSSITIHPGAVFCGNSGVKGGAIGVNDATLCIEGGVISNNTASTEGGGVWIGNSGACVISGGTITHNKAPSYGGVCVRGTLRISGTPVIRDNTLSDGTTENNVGLLGATKLTLAGPLLEGAAIGVTYASGAEYGVFGVTEIEQEGSGAARIFYDGNPVEEKTRTGCAWEGTLLWVNEGEDPNEMSIRATNDGGVTWVPKATFKEAMAYMTSGTGANNIMELRKDLMVTDADKGGDSRYPGVVGVYRDFTLRSKDVRRTMDWSQCTAQYFACGGSKQGGHCFSNVVITGMKQMMQTRVWIPLHFYDGVLFTNNHVKSYSPVYADGDGSIHVHPGAVFTGNSSVNGGAFGLANAVMTMEGGVISNNTASSKGGAIFMNQGYVNTLTVTGGLIADNTAPANAGDAIYTEWHDGAKTNTIRVSGSPVIRGTIYGANDFCTNTLVQIGDLGPTAEISLKIASRPAAKGGPVGFTTGDFAGAEQICSADNPALTAVRDGDRLVWTDTAILGCFARETTGDASFSKIIVRESAEGFLLWKLNGALTLAEGTTVDLTGIDYASLAGRESETITLLEATSIAGGLSPTRQSGAQNGWFLRLSGNRLVLRRNKGVALILR